MTLRFALPLILAVLARPAMAESFLDPAGPVASGQAVHFWRAIAILSVAILPVLVLVPVFLWRYRYGRTRARYDPDWAFSLPLDVAMWGAPLAIIGILSFWLIRDTQALDPWRGLDDDGPPLRVQVVGLDWKWLFIYPDLNIATVGEMAFPVDRAVALELTTDTVMQSFAVARLAGQVYAMPGMRTQLHLAATGEGTFQGENMQYNGDGFAHQKFATRAVSQADFDGWVERIRADGLSLNLDTYATLARPSTKPQAQAALGVTDLPDGILHFADVSPALFEGVIGRYRRGTPVPSPQQPGGASYVAVLDILPPGICTAPDGAPT